MSWSQERQWAAPGVRSFPEMVEEAEGAGVGGRVEGTSGLPLKDRT